MNIEDLAGAINSANPFLDTDDRQVADTIYRLLAEGTPVAIEDIAHATNRNVDSVRHTLDSWTGVFRDDDDRIIGFWGLALPEMGHRFELDGRPLHLVRVGSALHRAAAFADRARRLDVSGHGKDDHVACWPRWCE